MAAEMDIVSEISVLDRYQTSINVEDKILVDYKTLKSDSTAKQKAVLVVIGQ